LIRLSIGDRYCHSQGRKGFENKPLIDVLEGDVLRILHEQNADAGADRVHQIADFLGFRFQRFGLLLLGEEKSGHFGVEDHDRIASIA
jgi:hypothetical protein